MNNRHEVSGDGTAPPQVARISLRDILTILFRRKKLIITIFGVMFFAIALVTILEDDVYKSDACLIMRFGREDISSDPAVMGSTLGVSRNRENEINSEISIITSRTVIEQVVDTLGVDTILEGKAPSDDHDAEERRLFAVNKVSRDLHVEREDQSNNIRLSFISGSPVLAQLILSTVIDVYLKRHIEVFRSDASLDFFRKRKQELLDEIKQKEARMAAFQKEHGIIDPERQQQLLTDQIMNLQNRSDAIKRQLISLHARRNILQKDILNIQPYSVTSRVSGMPNRTAETLKARLVELRIQEADLKAKYPETSTIGRQQLATLRDKIAMVEQSLKEEGSTLTEETTAPNATYQALSTALRSTERTLKELSAEQSALIPLLDERLEQRARLLDATGKLQDFQREIDSDRAEYKRYISGYQKAEISAALDRDQLSNVAIVQPATTPIKPIAPDRKRNLALGLLVSMLAAMAAALVREYFDDTIKSGRDIDSHLKRTMLAEFSTEEFRQCN